VSESSVDEANYILYKQRDQPHPGFASWFVPGSRAHSPARPGALRAMEVSTRPDTPHASQPYTNGPLHNIFASLRAHKSAPESAADDVTPPRGAAGPTLEVGARGGGLGVVFAASGCFSPSASPPTDV
jgi:hypothetical protein